MIAQTPSLALRHLGRIRTAVVAPHSRSLHTWRPRGNNDPQLKRQGPAASPLDKDKFDNQANSPGYYESHKYKNLARSDPFPNSPVSHPVRPEPEAPDGVSGSFSDHRGGGPRVAGESLVGSEEAKETRTIARAGQILKNAAKSLAGSRSFSTSPRHSIQLKPTQSHRLTPAVADKGSLNQHPGYTTGDAPISGRDPSHLPPPPATAKPSSQVQNASTKAAPAHPDVQNLAIAAGEENVDAIHPEQRTTNSWGMNAKSAQFNQHEGRRNPIRDGGSHEGGFRSDGSSRT
ncbi:hypothetical protein ACQY0O_002580 [Thecaphora frezii]